MMIGAAGAAGLGSAFGSVAAADKEHTGDTSRSEKSRRDRGVFMGEERTDAYLRMITWAATPEYSG